MRDNSQRARNAIILLWIVLGLETAMLISSGFQYELLMRLSKGVDISDEATNSNDIILGIIGLLYTVAYIISAITFIQWFRRAYYNLHTKVKSLSYTEGWAAGSWFIPILNLFRPYVIMKELHHETEKIISENVGNYRHKINYLFIGLWWALWIIIGIFAQVTTRLSLRAETVDELIMSTGLDICGCVLALPLALLIIKIVKDYAKMETILYAIDHGNTSLIGFDDTYDDILDVPL